MAQSFGAIDNRLSRTKPVPKKTPAGGLAGASAFKAIDAGVGAPPVAAAPAAPPAPPAPPKPEFTPIAYGALDAQGDAELNAGRANWQNALNNADTDYNQGEAENKAQQLAAEQLYARMKTGTVNNAAARGALRSGILAFNQSRDAGENEKRMGALSRMLSNLATNRERAKVSANQRWTDTQNTVLGNANARLNAAAQQRYNTLYGGA